MSAAETIRTIRTELETGIALPKCRKCGCMDSGLKSLATVLPSVETDDWVAFAQDVSGWLEAMHPIQYTCLGCEHCYPAVAQNAFAQAYPAANPVAELTCEFRGREAGWPPVVGEYFVLDPSAPVAVSTLASMGLAEALAQRKPRGLAIVGKTETENIGVDKIIKNVIANPGLRHLIVAGTDPRGHQPGRTLLALAANGIDENGRVMGAPGKRPILRNVTLVEIETFREKVQVIDMIGCESLEEIGARIEELSQPQAATCGCTTCNCASPLSISAAPVIVAPEPSEAVKLDQAGYFVIVPLPDKSITSVEQYAYDNTLVRTIEGSNARAIYTTIIKAGWVTELSHAAYLGKELAKAELSLTHGFKYVQDGA